jgi:hypothetical protein
MENTAGFYGFFIAGTIGFALVAGLLLLGARRVRDRSATRSSMWLSKYEVLVSSAMLVGAVIALCSICLVLFTLLNTS